MSEIDFKNTLNLPSTKFPMRGDLVKREPSRIQHWQKIDLYKKIQNKNADKPKFRNCSSCCIGNLTALQNY